MEYNMLDSFFAKYCNFGHTAVFRFFLTFPSLSENLSHCKFPLFFGLLFCITCDVVQNIYHWICYVSVRPFLRLNIFSIPGTLPFIKVVDVLHNFSFSTSSFFSTELLFGLLVSYSETYATSSTAIWVSWTPSHVHLCFFFRPYQWVCPTFYQLHHPLYLNKKYYRSLWVLRSMWLPNFLHW